MKLCAFSDIHGFLNFTIEPSDVVCICGDIVPLRIQKDMVESEKWLKDVFIPWCQRLPTKLVLLVAGNHDFFIYFYADRFREWIKETNIRYLLDQSFVFETEKGGKTESVTFYGTPWCHKFGLFAFMDHNDSELYRVFSAIPNNLDILLTHDATYGISDVCTQSGFPSSGKHIGSIALFRIVTEKQPRLHLHGHLHTSNHECEKINNTSIYNVSLLDEQYQPAFQPLYLEFNKM